MLSSYFSHACAGVWGLIYKELYNLISNLVFILASIIMDGIVFYSELLKKKH